MFDIGFSELVLVMIVGLVVLGPQRMPIAIRTVMGWIRTIRGLAANVQNELSQELKLKELQESIKKAEHLNLNELSPELSKTVEELKVSAQKMKADLDQKAASTNESLKKESEKIQQSIEQAQQVPSSEKRTDTLNESVVSAKNVPSAVPEGKTAEQLAKEEREKAIAEMLEKYQTEDPLASAQPTQKNH